ncbi:hypothetical protein D3C80_2191210 [compost metagenome]
MSWIDSFADVRNQVVVFALNVDAIVFEHVEELLAVAAQRGRVVFQPRYMFLRC